MAGQVPAPLLCVESPVDARFGWENADALATIGTLLGTAIDALRQAGATLAVLIS